MLEKLIKKAQTIQREDYNDRDKTDGIAMTLAWWSFSLAMSLEKALDLLMASLPGAIQAILGGPLTCEELLMLPSEWEGCAMWGVYTDVLTKKVEEDAT